MIAKLTGVVDSTGSDWAIIDVGGVGYLAGCSRRTLAGLGAKGSAARLLTEVRLRDEIPHLFGFIDAQERDWFRLLTTVQGVGAKVALGILSTLTPDKLTLAIAAGDKVALSQADGVGPKLAVRLVTELKDKVGGIGSENDLSAFAAVGEAGGITGDAISALINLGYGRSDVMAAVARSQKDATALPELIRLALKELSA